MRYGGALLPAHHQQGSTHRVPDTVRRGGLQPDSHAQQQIEAARSSSALCLPTQQQRARAAAAAAAMPGVTSTTQAGTSTIQSAACAGSMPQGTTVWHKQPVLMSRTCAGSTLQGTTVWVAEQMIAPCFMGGAVVQFQPAHMAYGGGQSEQGMGRDDISRLHGRNWCVVQFQPVGSVRRVQERVALSIRGGSRGQQKAGDWASCRVGGRLGALRQGLVEGATVGSHRAAGAAMP